MKKLLFYSVIIFYITSCVPARQYEELKTKNSKCDDENERLRANVLEINTRNLECIEQINQHKKAIEQLKQDTANLGADIRRMNALNRSMTESLEMINNNNDKLLASNQTDTKKVINQLQMTQKELQKKEDALKQLERELNTKEANMNELNLTLQEREKRLAELEQILFSKDSVVNALKKTVNDALVGFTGNGLTVTKKNGKVYVSLEESLLFATGSIVVDKEGAVAIKKLAKVLESNADINVLIEGHTDNVPMKGAGEIKDNWDLSVMRATSVVKIITANSKVNPLRLTAAGRGEFDPIARGNSAEERKKNRRIEIILTPKLDEIFKVIETN